MFACVRKLMKDMMRRVRCECLQENTYKIICPNCRKTYVEGNGDLTAAAKASLPYGGRNCAECGAPLELLYNVRIPAPRYDAEHPYPDFDTDIKI